MKEANGMLLWLPESSLPCTLRENDNYPREIACDGGPAKTERPTPNAESKSVDLNRINRRTNVQLHTHTHKNCRVQGLSVNSFVDFSRCPRMNRNNETRSRMMNTRTAHHQSHFAGPIRETSLFRLAHFSYFCGVE